MPKASSNSINNVLATSASKKAGLSKSIVTRGYTKFLKTKMHDDCFGSVRIDKLMKKPALEFKKFEEIYKTGQEQGIFRDQDSAKKLFKEAQREEKKMAIEEQKAKKIEKTTTKEEAVTLSRRISSIEDRRRRLMFGGREEKLGGQIEKQGTILKEAQVYEAGKEFREREKAGSLLQKSEERKYEIGFKHKMGERGAAAAEEKANQFLNRVTQEEKSGGNIPTNQKSGGPQGLGLKGTTGIDQLTHPDRVTEHKDFIGGPFHVKGLDQPPASQPDSPPASKPVSAPDGIDELNIG